jgi:hypothetical protein
MPYRQGHGLVEPILKQAAVGQTRQLIVVGQVAGLRLLMRKLNKFML